MLRQVLSWLYDQTLRPHLPRRLAVYNGVAAPSHYRLFDMGYSPARLDYEASLCESIRGVVDEGDSVSVVGGGKGVSSIIAAKHNYPDGQVQVFEASKEQYRDIKRSCDYHPAGERVNINHAAVGDMSNAYGEVGDPEKIRPNELPPCDVLVIDAEGAESDILPQLEQTPEAIIVESHGCFGSPTESVRKELESNGYDVNKVGYEDQSKDVAVLLGLN